MATCGDLLCGVCEVQRITRFADHWCPECEEGLCSDYQKHHSLFKGAQNHSIIPVDQYKKLPWSISEIVHCKHHGIKYTNYCPYHDTLCCPNCISTTHGDCKGFRSIQEIIKTTNTATPLDNMEQSLADIENNIEKVIQNREHNMTNIRQQRQKFQDDLKNLRDKINAKLDTLEQNLIADLNIDEEKIQTKIENLINRLYKERKFVHGLTVNIKSLKEYASDLQTFLGTKTYQLELEKAEKYMNSLSEDGSLDQLNLKCSTDDTILQLIDSITLGSVCVETGPLSLVLTTTKDKQAQSPKSITDINLMLLNAYNIPKPTHGGYRGCAIHPSGDLILTSGSKLIVLNNDGEVENEIPCPSWVNDVTVIDDSTVAVSTYSGIHIIDIASNQIQKVIKTKRQCYGITYHNGALLWCQHSKGIQRLDLSDDSITTLVKQDQLPCDSYITTHGDQLYLTNRITKTVTCYTSEGNILWEFENGSILRDPVGITVDSNGYIYITTFDSHDVVLIAANGKEGRQLLNGEKDLRYPYGIYFDKNKNNVLIVKNNGPAYLYHVS